MIIILEVLIAYKGKTAALSGIYTMWKTKAVQYSCLARQKS